MFEDCHSLDTYLNPPTEIDVPGLRGPSTAAVISPCSSAAREMYSTTKIGMSTEQQEAATSSSPETAIKLLFHAMGGYIPKVFLDRASCSQRRLEKDGKQVETIPQDAGLDQNLVHVLDAAKLRQSIEHLISLSAISARGTGYVCQDQSVRELFEQSRKHWIDQAFMLCCYIFPRSPGIDPL